MRRLWVAGLDPTCGRVGVGASWGGGVLGWGRLGVWTSSGVGASRWGSVADANHGVWVQQVSLPPHLLHPNGPSGASAAEKVHRKGLNADATAAKVHRKGPTRGCNRSGSGKVPPQGADTRTPPQRLEQSAAARCRHANATARCRHADAAADVVRRWPGSRRAALRTKHRGRLPMRARRRRSQPAPQWSRSPRPLPAAQVATA